MSDSHQWSTSASPFSSTCSSSPSSLSSSSTCSSSTSASASSSCATMAGGIKGRFMACIANLKSSPSSMCSWNVHLSGPFMPTTGEKMLKNTRPAL